RLGHAERRTWQVDDRSAKGLRVSGDGSRVAFWKRASADSDDGPVHVKVLDVATGREVRSWRGETPARAGRGTLSITLAPNRDGTRLAAAARMLPTPGSGSPRANGEADGQVTVYDVVTGKAVLAVKAPQPTQLTLSPDGRRLALAEATRAVQPG